jgi:hypothetical protein
VHELEQGALSHISPAQQAGFLAVIGALSEAQL